MIAEPKAGVMLLVAAPARNVGAGGAAARSVVYEFVTSKPLAADVKDGRLAVEVALPTAGGRLLRV